MLEDVQATLDGDYQLTKLTAMGVRSDGFVELIDKDVNGHIHYEFTRAVEPPADQPPLGAGGSAEWREEVDVNVRRRGWHSSSMSHTAGSNHVYSRGLETSARTRAGAPSGVIDPPTCSFADLWRVAIENGTPEGAVAYIQYRPTTRDGPEYLFSILNTSHSFKFNEDCSLK